MSFTITRNQDQEEELATPSAEPQAIQGNFAITRAKDLPPPQATLGVEAETIEQTLERPWYERLGKGLAMQAETAQAGNVPTAKGLASGTTLGLTENIKALQAGEGEEEAFGMAKFAGEMAPIDAIHGLYSKGLQAATKGIKYAPMAINALSRLVASGLTGATIKGAEDVFQGKMPTAADLTTHGATWMAIDAALGTVGQATKFGANLLRSAKKTGQAPHEIVNNISQQLLNKGVDLNNPKAVSKAVLSELDSIEKQYEKLDPKRFKQLVEETPKSPKIEPIEKPILTEEEFANTIDKTAEKTNELQLNEISQKPFNKQDATKNVQDMLAINLGEAKEAYTPLYKSVEPVAEKIKVSPEQTIETAEEIISYIDSVETKPEGYAKVRHTAETALRDLGVSTSVPGAKYPGIKIKEPITLAKSQEIGRRLGKVADFDLEGASIKKQVNKILGVLKRENNALLKAADPVAHKNFEQAEKLYGETAQKYGQDSISRVRNLQKLETGTDIIKQATTVKDLKNILDPEQFAHVERQVVENIQDLDYKKAKKYYEEVYQYLSPKSRGIAESAIKSKKPLSPLNAKTEQIKGAVLDELRKTQVDGSTPKQTLKMWQNAKGRKLVKAVMKKAGVPKEVAEYLNQQTFYDFASKFVEADGRINQKALSEFTKNANFMELAKEIGGPEAAEFIQKLDSRMLVFESNVKRLEGAAEKQIKLNELMGAKAQKATYGKERIGQARTKIEKAIQRQYKQEFPIISKLEDIYESIGVGGKIMVYSSGVSGIGLVKGATAYVGAKVLYNIMKNPAARAAFRKAASKNISPAIFLTTLKQLDKLSKKKD